MPGSVLIANPDLQWLALAVPLVLQQDLATVPAVAATLAPDVSSAYQLASTQVLRTVVEERDGRFRVQATLTDAQTQKNAAVWEQTGPVAAGIIPLLDTLARKFDGQRATLFSTRSDQALKLFCAAVQTADAAKRQEALRAAVGIDPAFGLGQIALLENSSGSGSSLGIEKVNAARFTSLDRARWTALAARQKHASLAQQTAAELTVVQLAPNDVEALGTLGVQRFLQGNGTEGERYLRRAIALSPSNPGLPIQLAQGFVAVRRYADALAVLNPLSASNPNLLPTIALIQLLDRKNADATATFNRILSFLPAGSPVATSLRKQWDRFASGADMQVSLPQSPSPLAPGFTAFLGKQYGDATQFWRDAVDKSGDTNLEARTMLAASLRGEGKMAEAHAIRVQPFIPDFGDPYGPIAFHSLQQELNVK